jgi:hypothetical protein
MTTRTIKFMGNAYSTEGDVTLRVTVNGTEVHNGTVVTTASEIPGAPAESSSETELFNFTLDSSVNGDVPVTIEVSGGDAVFAYLHGNYGIVGGVQGDDPATIWDHMHLCTAEEDGKHNPAIDGESVANRRPTQTGEFVGPWFYVICNGETFTCDYEIDPTRCCTNTNNYPAAE